MSTRSMLLVKSFKTEEQGSVAVMFSLMSVALLFLGGMAVDYSRITDVHTRLVSAVDAASLAAGRAMLDGKLSDDEIIAMAEKYFDANVKNTRKMGPITKPDIKINRVTGAVDISVRSDVAMTVSRVGGFQTMAVPVVQQAVYKQKDIEVGMALDITGSMGDPDKGGRAKIDGLKQAFGNFAERLLPDDNKSVQKVRIGLAPYSAGIKLGGYAAAASANKSTDGCVTERKNGSYSDDTSTFFVSADGNKDVDPTEGIYGYVCPEPVVTPLTDDKSTLISEVNNFRPRGGTSGHFGVQWAWNLVSDNWAGTWGSSGAPDSYDLVKEEKLLKAVVLMTDGVFNTAFHGQKSAQQAVALCNAMKAKGVVVFSVGFGLGGNATALNTLKSCATAGDDYFADASNADELDAAFQKFAGKLTELRISK